MGPFRFQLIAVTSVFVALGVGLGVGTALHRPSSAAGVRVLVLVTAAGASDVDGVVAMLRAAGATVDRVLASTVSTVDNVTTPQGRLLTAWALADQPAGRTGHYGTGTGAALIPPRAD